MEQQILKDYKDRLERSVCEYMKMPIGQKSAEAVKSMFEAMDVIDDRIRTSKEMTNDDYIKWNQMMHNSDGSVGGHWTIDQTNSLGVPENITDECWNAICNLMYSDYCTIANAYGVSTAEFYSDMARAFLEDEDAIDNKVGEYYLHIVKKN